MHKALIVALILVGTELPGYSDRWWTPPGYDEEWSDENVPPDMPYDPGSESDAPKSAPEPREREWVPPAGSDPSSTDIA